jgi:hypothetical protein
MMSKETNKQVMSRFVQFINTADPQLADQLISPKTIFYVPGRAEPMEGPQGYLTIIAMMRSGFPDIQWALDELILDDAQAHNGRNINHTRRARKTEGIIQESKKSNKKI